MRSHIFLRIAVTLSLAVVALLTVAGRAGSQCSGYFWTDVNGNAYYTESCTVPGQLSYGWFNWSWTDSSGTCYDYRPPYCNDAGSGDPSPDSCGDDRDNIIAEYRNHGVAVRPYCVSFTTGGGYGDFMFPRDLNHGDHQWGIIRNGILYERLDVTQYYYQTRASDAVAVNSGYRCPIKNASLNPPGATNSRHVYGDGADIRAKFLDKCAQRDNVQWAAYQANAGFVQAYDPPDCHVHADWRNF